MAIITATNKRARQEASQFLIDITTADGQLTGLLHESTVKAEHLDTVDQRDIVRTIGKFSDVLMTQVEECIKSALRIP